MQKDIGYKLNKCLDCFNCKSKGDKIYCVLGYFGINKKGELNHTASDDDIFLIPEDYDCSDFESMD